MKYQLQKVLASISFEAQKNKDPEVKERFYKIKRICSSKKSIARVCRSEGISREWFYKWGKRLLKGKSLSALESKSRCPDKSPRKTRPRIEKKVCRIRRVQPFLGAERIQDDLMRLYKEKCAVSTINNILRRNNFIGKEKAKRLTKKHLGKIHRPLPGYLQMDFKYVPYKVQDKQYYQLSCIDHLTSWRFIRIYPEKNTKNTILFLKELVQIVPFPIISIQTDNDAAFTDKYTSTLGAPSRDHLVDKWCAENDIIHKLIPLGEKELNGKVENSHKQDDREFFSQVRALTPRALELASFSYNDRWNENRRTKRLCFKTPIETVINAYAVVIAWMDLLMNEYQPNQKPIVGITLTGDTYLKVNEIKQKKKIKTRRKSKFSRCVDYLLWGDENKAG